MQPILDMQPSSETKGLLTFRNKIRTLSYRNLRRLEEEATNPLSTELEKMPGSNHSMGSCSSNNPSGTDVVICKAADSKMQPILDWRTPSPSNDTPFTESMRSGSNESLHDTSTSTTDTSEEECVIEAVGQTTDDASIATHPSLSGNAKSQEEISLIISSRDKIIASLEDTLNQNLNDMQNMQAEILCLMEGQMEAQHVRENRISRMHKQTEHVKKRAECHNPFDEEEDCTKKMVECHEKEHHFKNVVEPHTPRPSNNTLFPEGMMRSWSIGNLQKMLSNPYKQKEESLEKLAEPHSPSPSDSTPLHESMHSGSSGSLHDTNTSNISEEECIVETVAQAAGDTVKANQNHLHENEQFQEEIPLIVSSRDKTIISLEQTLNQQLNSMHNMQAEIVHLMEREKNLTNAHKQKEERLEKLIVSLGGKLEANEMRVKNYRPLVEMLKRISVTSLTVKKFKKKFHE